MSSRETPRFSDDETRPYAVAGSFDELKGPADGILKLQARPRMEWGSCTGKPRLVEDVRIEIIKSAMARGEGPAPRERAPIPGGGERPSKQA
jgi:hypothetical protein